LQSISCRIEAVCVKTLQDGKSFQAGSPEITIRLRNFEESTALLIAFGWPYHSRPNDSASEIRSKTASIFARANFVNVQQITYRSARSASSQGQAQIVSTAIRLPRSCEAGAEVEATPCFRTWFSIDPQPASISPTIKISIVFIFASLVDHGRIVCRPAIKNDSSAILRSGKRFVVRANEKLTAFLELESAIPAFRELS
jgi:hypothetical protein